MWIQKGLWASWPHHKFSAASGTWDTHPPQMEQALGYSAAPWRCPGLDLAGAGAPWQWFLSSSTGDLMTTSTSSLKLGLSNIPPVPETQLPVSKTAYRRMCFSSWEIGKIRSPGSEEQLLSGSGAKLLPKEHSKQADSILRWEKSCWQREDGDSMPLIVRCTKASIK